MKGARVLRSLNTAEDGMAIQQLRIQTLANNLANVDATGFKQILTRVQSEGATALGAVDQAGEGTQPERTAAEITAEAAGAAVGTTDPSAAAGLRRDAWTWSPVTAPRLEAATDMRPGPLRNTGRATDLALLGDGFFVVQDGDLETYTRNGAFTLDGEGRLSTADGKPVLGDGGPLKLSGGEFAVGRDGTVLVGGAEVGRLRVVSFSDPARLQHVGSGRLRSTADMAPRSLPADEVRIEQGRLEGSNVDPIRTLVDMIAAQRAFEIGARVVQAADQTLDHSVNELGRTR
jgi:flagellar basal-body rod protein FlgF